ncbi:protein IDA, partial [Abrus precatorius]|uniref:Protein IDA n=1 Tax=Abrus precatorius TaxID=3816 RepID=A0A8B8M2V3_ABRPR
MANRHSSKCLHLPCKTLSLVLLLIYLLLVGSSEAIRTGQTMRLNERLKGKHNKQSFPYQSMVFNFFPKGSVPPSGPSKRHNAIINNL